MVYDCSHFVEKYPYFRGKGILSCHYKGIRKRHQVWFNGPLAASSSQSVTLADASQPDLSQQMWHNTSGRRNVGERTNPLCIRSHFHRISVWTLCRIMCTEKKQKYNGSIFNPPEMLFCGYKTTVNLSPDDFLYHFCNCFSAALYRLNWPQLYTI